VWVSQLPTSRAEEEEAEEEEEEEDEDRYQLRMVYHRNKRA
jgi:hypothetical protein